MYYVYSSPIYVYGFCLREDLKSLNCSYLKPTQNIKKLKSDSGLWYIRGKYSFGPRFSVTDNGIWFATSIKAQVIKLQKGLYGFKGLQKVSPCAFSKMLLQISLLPSMLAISVGIMMDNWNKIILCSVKALLRWFLFFCAAVCQKQMMYKIQVSLGIQPVASVKLQLLLTTWKA